MIILFENMIFCCYKGMFKEMRNCLNKAEVLF